jgi:hypothetical protein
MHAHLEVDATRKETHNQRQRKCREQQKSIVGNVMAIINELALEVKTFVNLYKSTSKYADLLVGEQFHQTAPRGLEFQRLLLLKILKHQI